MPDGGTLIQQRAAVSFTVPGTPAPQGSKVRTAWGMREDNPATRPWKTSVAFEAAQAIGIGSPFLDGPVELHAVFFFHRPKSHFRTGRFQNDLRPDAPALHATKPDADKLARAIGDAITGVIVRDDSQIARWLIEKRYGTPRAEITVRTIDELKAAA